MVRQLLKTTIKDNYKKRLFWMTNEDDKLGLFGLISSEWDGYKDDPSKDQNKWKKEDILKVNKKFIENCGSTDLSKQNQEIVVKFKKENDGLVPVDNTLFDKWFLTEEEGQRTLYKETVTTVASSG